MSSLKMLLVGGTLVYAGFSAASFIVDQIGPSTASVYTTDEASSDTAELNEQAIAQLLAGADPTDLFEPTAAGQPLNTTTCFTGTLETDSAQHTHLEGARFIAKEVNDDQYITVMTLPPVHLFQNEYQAVTAQKLDRLPTEVQPKMRQVLASQEQCQQRSLYLSRID